MNVHKQRKTQTQRPKSLDLLTYISQVISSTSKNDTNHKKVSGCRKARAVKIKTRPDDNGHTRMPRTGNGTKFSIFKFISIL